MATVMRRCNPCGKMVLVDTDKEASSMTELAAQRDRAHDCLQGLLDYIHMIAPEASAEEIDEAKRVLRMLGDE